MAILSDLRQDWTDDCVTKLTNILQDLQVSLLVKMTFKKNDAYLCMKVQFSRNVFFSFLKYLES